MNQKNKIGIIGCGWLGLPLAKLLIEKNYPVKGSSTSKEKLNELKSFKIDPYLIEITAKEIKGEIILFLKNLDVLVINIPPNMKRNSNTNYSKKIKFIAIQAKKQSVNKIIFVSSTSVYGSNQGKIDYSTEPNPNSKNGFEILKSEKIITENNKCTIIRFGGLIGNSRHPVYSLSKKKEVLNPKAPINLIHLKDCIQIIYTIIKMEAWGKTYLGVSPYHPSKMDYYNNKCKELGLKNINFINNNSINKEITDSKIQTELNYNFIQPEL
tara:strand:- start:2609 stop:3412 length:804 start_codon:yes stop_codon:yes gene_type:complete